jgi:rubrerythrin
MSPKEVTEINLTEEIFKEPVEVVNKITSNMEINYTKVIQTYVMEERKLDLILEEDGDDYFKGKIVWIGNKKDDTSGTIFCVDIKGELKQLNPTEENTEKAILDLKKEKIKILTSAKSKCSVCGKKIEIFDDIAGCPICGAKAHKNHILEWIKMKNTCPACKKPVHVSSTGAIHAE